MNNLISHKNKWIKEKGRSVNQWSGDIERVFVSSLSTNRKKLQYDMILYHMHI